MRPPFTWPTPRRRGLTLVEMMVTVGLVLIIMTIIVSIFTQATGAVSSMQVYQDLDANLRRLDTTLRQDLAGVTAHMTPPNDPNTASGYFEYGENAYADSQGEDTDDYLAFTSKAPEGRPFTGRMMVPARDANGMIVNDASSNPIYNWVTVESQFAEVIYFLRNGSLYRRVLLIVPERQGTIAPGTLPNGAYLVSYFGGSHLVSWQGMNDVSAHPPASGQNLILSTLGDLTNRENRFARPRFTNDYITNSSGSTPQDGQPDDVNGDGIPDYYPTLFPNMVSALGLTLPYNTYDALPFPFLFPGDYSVADPTSGGGATAGLHFIGNPINHAPQDIGDNLPIPTPNQTWWGFPTWRETLLVQWTDPVWMVNGSGNGQQSPGLSWDQYSRSSGTFFLPPMTSAYRLVEQPFNDGTGQAISTASPSPWTVSWEDDLIASGVRSFDVKAYDPNAGVLGFAPGYYDLGYGYQLTGTTPVSLATLGHEGRIPPLAADMRYDPQRGTLLTDRDQANTIRMRRVWDSWSTAYTSTPTNLFNVPVYPSYPPPYPVGLQGIQIQIRMVDPRNERIRVLTIRQDFTEKL